ncbi:MAG: hypothetical protein IKX54_00390 [Lachnospiraceae bacterium]|nr:hypothetical protein [Lachnospiraceae bacterium]
MIRRTYRWLSVLCCAAMVMLWLPAAAKAGTETDARVNAMREEDPQTTEETPSPTPKTYTFTEMERKGTAAKMANLRSIPEYSEDPSVIVGTLPLDVIVDVTGQCNESKYYRIIYKDQVVYVSNNYLVLLTEEGYTPTPTPTPEGWEPTPTPTPKEVEETPTPSVTPEPSPTPVPTEAPTPTPGSKEATPTPAENDATPTPAENEPTKAPDGNEGTPTPKPSDGKESKNGQNGQNPAGIADDSGFAWWMLAIPGLLILVMLCVMILCLNNDRKKKRKRKRGRK